ncbi:MAG: hypothetical protein B7Y45_09740 [Sphingomonas sp. 28-66-16]|nr:MAG: hypothetical protein B7Y45_09740 [Sphingomonas sp. 28-66-16]
MLRPFLIAALLALPAAASAQDQTEKGAPPTRIRSVLLKVGERCPEATGDEIVVCSPLEDPYRIPKALRDRPIPPANQSWVNRAATIDEVGRVAGGLPDTCSPTGTGGQSGCTQQLIQRWAAERKAQASGGPEAP